MRKADPRRREFRPERRDQEHRQALKAVDDLVKEFSGCWIEPVRILQHDQYRSPSSQPFKLRQKSAEEQPFFLQRRHRGNCFLCAGRNAK